MNRRPPEGVRWLQVSVPPYTKRGGFRVWWDGTMFRVDGDPMADGFLATESLTLLKPVELATAYHISDPKNRASIQERGLLPSKPKAVANEKAVYLFGDIEDAEEGVREYGYDLWAVSTAGLIIYHDTQLQHLAAYVSMKAISPARVSLFRAAPSVS